MAKRVTFGKFVSKDTIPLLSDDIIKLMHSSSRDTSGHKHVLFYYVFNRIHLNTRQPTKTGLSPNDQLIEITRHFLNSGQPTKTGLSPNDQLIEITRHFLNSGLIHYPTDVQLYQITAACEKVKNPAEENMTKERTKLKNLSKAHLRLKVQLTI